MKKRIIYSIFLMLVLSNTFAQKKNGKVFNAEGDNAIYTKEWSVGLRFHTNAISGFFEHVWIKDIKRRKLLQVNIFGYFDLRDKAINSQVSPKDKKYFFGKQNNFYSTQLMYGWRRVIANKSEEAGVKLSLTYMAGITLGILKPYYLEIQRTNGDKKYTTDERYLPETKDVFLDKNIIVGAADFGVGNEKIRFAPGLTAKLGMNFDFARKNTFVTSIEVGAQIDVFYQKLNIYINDTNKPYILNLYLSLQLGKRS